MEKKLQNFYLVLVGVLTGFINGFFGGGGGMIVVPLLTHLLKLKPKISHATAIAIILPISFISSFAYVFSNQTNWFNVLMVTIGSVIGGVIGAILLKKIKAKWLGKIFACLMVIAGVKMAFF